MRVSAAFTPQGGSSPVRQDFVWDGDNLLMDSINAYIYTNISGNSGAAPLEQVNLSTGATTYLSTDVLGSVRGTVSSSGTLTATTSYDAWGNPQKSAGLTATTPYGYAGGYTDPDGLVYLIDRYYDSATGQFISVDPDVSQTMASYASMPQGLGIDA
jgi:RHS repeat-associated protein